MAADLSLPDPGAVAALHEALCAEQRHCAHLLELARSQGELMGSHDLGGLQDAAGRLNDALAAAEPLRRRREELARAVMQVDAAAPTPRLSVWLDRQPAAVRERLAGPVRALRRTAGDLARANELNRRLASFCLDLVEEEAALLRRCVLEDPAGCYDRGAQPARQNQGGVLRRQA
jgi:hypothetical protein